jgi:hypothetical protein
MQPGSPNATAASDSNCSSRWERDLSRHQEIEMKQVKANEVVQQLRQSPADGSSRSLHRADQLDQRKQLATLNATGLIGGFRNCKADDPEIYFHEIERVLGRYDVDIQKQVADSSLWEYPPTTFELRKRCDAISSERAEAGLWDKAVAETLARRREAETDRKALTYQPRDIPARETRIDRERREAKKYSISTRLRRRHRCGPRSIPPSSNSIQRTGTIDDRRTRGEPHLH